MKIDQIINEMTSSGAVASVSMPLGATQKRAKESVDVKGLKPVSKLKNAKKKGPYANSIVENKEQVKVSEAELQEDDLIIIPGRGTKRKNGFVPKGQSRVDHEVEMARSDVLATMKNAKSIYHMLKNRSEEEGIEGWVQEKLIKANDYLNAVKEYYDEQMMQEMNGGVIAAGGVGEGVAEGSTDLYQKAIRKYAQQVANDYLNGGNEDLYGANKFDAEMFGVSQEKANKDFKTWFTMIVRSQAVRPRRGVAEGSLKEDEYDKYETGKMGQEEAVTAMFTRLARQGIDPIDMIANRFGWSTYELDDLAQQQGFENTAEWLNSFDQGVTEESINDASADKKFMIVYNKHHPNPAAHGKPVTGDGKPWIITATDRRAALDKAHEYFVRSQTVSSFRGYVDAVPVEQGVAEGSSDKVHLKTPKHGLADHPGRNTGVGLSTFAATSEQDRCPKCNSLYKHHYQKQGVAGSSDKSDKKS